MLTRVTVALTLTALPIFYVHHYWSSNTPAGLIFVYAVPPLLLPVIAWVYRRVRRESKPFEVVPALAAPPG
jgi:hypothetical protein